MTAFKDAITDEEVPKPKSEYFVCHWFKRVSGFDIKIQHANGSNRENY